jgi:hypothetical protein
MAKGFQSILAYVLCRRQPVYLQEGIVQIDKVPTEFLGKQSSGSGFAGAHISD